LAFYNLTVTAAPVRTARRNECDGDERESPAAMNEQARPLRARIRQAIEAPVGEAEKLLNELKDADGETRLSILISGWGRGLAGALEELAIAVDELQQLGPRETIESNPPVEAEDAVSEPTATPERAGQADLEEAGDERLHDEAKRSREQTAELRKQTEQARRELED
jgi:hypothetical protein